MKLYKENEYRATDKWPYAISAGCVVYRKTQDSFEVLLLPRDNTTNKWGRDGGQRLSHHLPKGHVGFNETLIQAAQRETTEEAGVSAEIESYLGSREDNFKHPNTGIVTCKTVHYFAASWQNDLKIKDNEHDNPIWVSLEVAENLLGPPMPKCEDEIIRRLRSFLELTDES